MCDNNETHQIQHVDKPDGILQYFGPLQDSDWP